MSFDTASFIGVCAVTAVAAVIMAIATRKITFYGRSTDNLIQMRAVADLGRLLCPSAVHKHAVTENGMRTQVKEAFLFGLLIMQRIMRNKNGDYPVVLICLAANMASAVLVYQVAQGYWNTEAALLAWGLYLTCILVYQHSIYGTPISLAQTFFLTMVYLLQQAESAGSLSINGWLVGAGVAAAFSLGSSTSSRKFFPLMIVVFIYSQRDALWDSGLAFKENLHADEAIGLVTLALAGVILLGSTAMRLGHRRLVALMYRERAPRWMNRFIGGRDTKGLEVYVGKAKELVHMGWQASLVIVIYLAVSTGLAQSPSFMWSQLSVAIGFSAVLLWFTYPDVHINLWGYFTHYQGWKTNRFTVYHRYFEKRGIPINEHMRGAGYLWIVRYYWRVAPVHFAFFVVYLALGLALLAFTDDIWQETWHAGGMLLFSWLMIMVAEFTQAPQFGRSYFPTFIGLMIFVAYAAFRMDESLAAPWREVFWAVSAVGVLVSSVWSLRMLLNDVLPARMGPAYLDQALRSNEIKEFYTYGNRYNDAFVAPMVMSSSDSYDVHYVDSLSEVSKGYMVIPGTSTKAANMSGMISEREHGDYFDGDGELNHLIESKEIEKYALASFKTFGTSRFWGQESEVISYQDLILGEIHENDRYRGRAWLIDVSKLREASLATAGLPEAGSSAADGALTKKILDQELPI